MLLADPSQAASDRSAVLVGTQPPAYTLVSVEHAYKVPLEMQVPLSIASSHWFVPTIEQFESVLALRPGWDSYNARSVDRGSAAETVKLLSETISREAEAPWVVPLPDGGVQLEWHRGQLDVEVTLSPTEGRTLYLEDLRSGEVWSGELDDLLDLLRQRADRLVA
jgi:hypothetical protein